VALRKHRRGELVIEQTRDLETVRSTLESGGMITHGIEWPAACYLLAFFGDDPVGVVGVEPMIDAALIRSLHVVEPMRRRGIATQLFAAARKAAHTRGARTIYLFAYAELVPFFARLGLTEVSVDELMNALGGTPEVEYYQSHLDKLGREHALRLDISQDGVIQR